MRSPKLLAFSLIVLTSACASTESLEPKSDTTWVKLSTYPGPWCGRCDTTTLIVHDDGEVFVEKGHWLFNYRFWQTRRRKAKVQQSAIAEFLEEIQPMRPEGRIDLFDIETCRQFMSEAYGVPAEEGEYAFDLDGIKIEWVDETGEDSLNAYFGCLGSEGYVFRGKVLSGIKNLGLDWLELPEYQRVATASVAT